LTKKLINEYTIKSYDSVKQMNISSLNKEKLISFGSFLMARKK